MPKNPPLSVAEAATRTDPPTPKRTIQAAIARGELKAHKMPGRTGTYLIQPGDFDRWIAKRDNRFGEKAGAPA